MTQEERDLIEKFVARVGGAAGGGWGRSVPSTQPNLPPIDPEAARFIAAQFDTHPEARYRITQMAVVQEAALAEAANRLQKMQAELEQLRAQAQAAPQAQPQQSRGGFLGGLFGGAASAPPPPQPGVWNQGQPQYQQPGPAMAPQYPPNTQPGMFAPTAGGTGFLGGALRTAAGVAGGVVAGNLLMDMFSGHGGGGFGGGGFGGGFGGGMPGGFGAPGEIVDTNSTTIINNNYGDAGGGQGGGIWDNATQGGDTGSWDTAQGGDTGGSWDDNSGGGGGFDDQSV